MTSGPAGEILLLCYGNPARLDDGLGPSFAAAIEKVAPRGVTVESNYQLTVEDAGAAADHRVVIFVDAAVSGPEPFCFVPVRPQAALGFSSHNLEPGNILALAEQLFGRRPEGYALGIRGSEFNEFGEQLSPAAQANLESALQFLLRAVERGDFAGAAAAMASHSGSGPAGNGD